MLGSNALHLAAAANPNPKVVETLIDAGFDKSATNSNGWTACDFAIEYNPNPEVADALRCGK